MPFPFTFKLSVPGLSNPFASSGPSTSKSPVDNDRSRARNVAGRLPRRRLSPTASLHQAAPLSRKRGWVPSNPEASGSTSTFTSTASGYLVLPSESAKCRQMASNRDESQHTTVAMIAELPPAKRRRTFAGSVVSAALNAALVGTAVGLTVFRLWRNRGKETEQLPPPPPYHQGAWTPELPQQPQQQTIQAPPPPTPRSRKTRQPHASSSTKRLNTHRRPRVRAHAYSPPPCTSTSALLAAPQPEFDFRHNHEDEIPVEDQMDWIGDKLTMLIQEGKKALSREVVVMSDAQEDEVDDGMGAWEEEAPAPTISRSGSLRRAKKPHNIGVPASPLYPSPPPTSSPRMAVFSHSQPSSYSAGIPVTPPRTTRGVSVDSQYNFREDEGTWESPELRESMEKARARFLKNRAT